MVPTRATHAKDMATRVIIERMLIEGRQHLVSQLQIGVEA